MYHVDIYVQHAPCNLAGHVFVEIFYFACQGYAVRACSKAHSQIYMPAQPSKACRIVFLPECMPLRPIQNKKEP